MPRFEPFAGLRYSPTHIRSLDDVVCPPYDVISDGQRSALAARSPSNIVRLELPVGDGMESGVDVYAAAATLLESWRDGGILHRDHQAAFYGHRMTYTDPAGEPRATAGVIGALDLEPPGDGILPHEHTTPKAKSDRLQLLRATRTNLSPIWALSPTTGLSDLCNPPAHPAEHTIDDDGVVHELWPITDSDQVRAIAELISSAPVLIADGHHRFETALTYQSEQSEADGADPGAGAIMALVVELADTQLTVQAIHRLVAGLPDGFDPVAALADHFELAPTGPVDATAGARMDHGAALLVVTTARTWLARPRPDTLAAAAHDLDSSRLDVALAGWPEHQLTFQHGWEEAAEAVGSGRAQMAVLLRPATVSQIAAISRGGVRMPPKTTFFWPKPRTGLVVRELLA